MAFTQSGSLVPFGAPILRREILANSVTFIVNDSVLFDTDGFVALSTAGAAVLGHMVAVGTDKGVGLNTTGVAGAEVGSFVDRFLTASDNETVAMVRGEIDLSTNTLYSSEADAVLATTAGSDQRGIYMDLIDANTLDESSVVDTTAQYHSWGPDPLNLTTHVIANIFESSVFTAA